MIQFILFVLGIIVFFFVIWPAWKRMVSDYMRDYLFDLRDELRKFCVDNNISLKNSTYQNSRELLNKQIRYIEDHTFISYFLFRKSYKNFLNDPSNVKYINDKFDKLFETKNKKFAKMLNRTRENASNVLITHMIFTSPFLITVGFVSVAIAGLIVLIKKLNFISIMKAINAILFGDPGKMEKASYLAGDSELNAAA